MKTCAFLHVFMCYNGRVKEYTRGEGAIPRLLLCAEKEVHSVNARRTMYKLQTALCAKGKLVRINQKQIWNEERGRMITKYLVLPEGAYKPVFESFQPHEIVKFLAGMLGGGDNE